MNYLKSRTDCFRSLNDFLNQNYIMHGYKSGCIKRIPKVINILALVIKQYVNG